MTFQSNVAVVTGGTAGVGTSIGHDYVDENIEELNASVPKFFTRYGGEKLDKTDKPGYGLYGRALELVQLASTACNGQKVTLKGLCHGFTVTQPF